VTDIPLEGITYVTDIALEGIYKLIEQKCLSHKWERRGSGSKFLPLNFNILFVRVSQKHY
jgi:hypothetical protein